MTPHRLPTRLLLVVALLATAAVLGVGAPAASAAGDPDHISFTLEGCRPNGPFTPPPFTCPDADYTTGNLGKFWNEGDLVPHRVTVANGGATQDYTFAIAADYRLGNTLGYDMISAPVLNAQHSDASCAAPTDTGTIKYAPPEGSAAGGVDQTIYRLITLHQVAGATCEYDYYQRLALPEPGRHAAGYTSNAPLAPIGASGYSGSSLQSHLYNQQLDSSGIGEKRVSIPVKDIKPQGFTKEVSGERGASNTWTVSKSAGTVDLPNTCTNGQSANVNVTIQWTKTTNPQGSTAVTTKFNFDNPSHRNLHVSVHDVLSSGGTQVDDFTYVPDPLANDPDANLAPGQTTFTVTKHYDANQLSSTATTLHNEARASYTDPVLHDSLGAIDASDDGPITTATGSAESATISDTESITGNGLTFSVDAPSSGSFDGGYTAGTKTTGPVVWNSGTVTDSGSITFTKTVYADAGSSGNGSLDDTATLTPSGGSAQTASASVPISTTSCGTSQIAIDKSGPANATAGDLLPYTLVVTNPGQESFAASTVVVTDPQCTSAPTLQSKNRGNAADPTPDSLDNGDSWVYVCSGQTQSGQTSFVNQACVQGTDAFGRQRNACDDVTTALAQPQQQVLGDVVVAGTARLAGRSGCVARAFYASVRGKQIDRVVFSIDGKKRATLHSPDARGRYKIKVNPRSFKAGSHLLIARSFFVADAQTKTKTMRLRFARCVRHTAPAFTG